ncbi:D-alanine--D-alanine ligase family protein [Mycolicibacterium arseniciresistens]|uniref:D-alanine--D-alanine ligase n=1 Tax=Mycolicibacterium arseniciresistens TaxID=3062257 RepID=A0ABT8UGV6_9MYCO|nr:D-alanine--D-alanine ligase [Mycolicibacterium arseniciresistens]MDO3637024.1 D-alanine--D-alanine ligase [Mycolicibacterium arseniciresistens]
MISVLHLVGSPVDEFHADLSRLYARDCLAALDAPHRYRHQIAYVAPGGKWCFPATLETGSIAAAESYSIAAAVDRLSDMPIDVAVPQMFCRPGMTTFRALLDLLGLQYLGNRPEVMAMTADKTKARAVVAAAGVPVPDAQTLEPGDALRIPLPVVVKPAAADNSAGVSLVRDDAEFGPAVDAATAHGSGVLVESYVELGREVRCGVVERDGELWCLPLEEYAVNPSSKPIRTAGDKLARGADGELFLVAKDVSRAWIVAPEDPVTQRVWAAARSCYRALGCRHYGLFDFRIDPDGEPWFLEAGLYCSFAASSVIAMMAAADGCEVADLFAHMLRQAEIGSASCSR